MRISRSLSVQSKLIAAFVLLTLVSIGVVSWIGYVSARESLRASSERELMGQQRSKALSSKPYSGQHVMRFWPYRHRGPRRTQPGNC